MTSSLSMESSMSRQLFDEYAFLILLDLPESHVVELGLDLNSWQLGPRFRGIKLIPPGVHLIHYALVTKRSNNVSTTKEETLDDPSGSMLNAGVTTRVSFVHCFRRKEVVAKRFDRSQELLLDVDPLTLQRISLDLKNLDASLAPYDFTKWKAWVALSNHVSETTLSRLTPICGHIFSVDDLMGNEYCKTNRKESSEVEQTVTTNDEGEMSQKKNTEDPSDDDHLLPKMRVRPGTSIRYSVIPTRRFPTDSSPNEITRHAMDHSYRLQLLLEHLHGLYADQVSSSMNCSQAWQELLGELQFAFLCFLICHNYASFEHWKELLTLLCSSHQAVVEHKELYMALLSDLHFQMKEVPSDLFVDIVSSNNFLHALLSRLFKAIRSQKEVDKDLKERAKRFEANVTLKFEWTFDNNDEDDGEEDEESKPVVVELTDHQRNLLFPQL